MYKINQYLYKCKKSGNKFIIYSREVSFADDLAKRISNLGIFNLRRVRFNFIKEVSTDIPPYDIELEQLDTVTNWENNKKLLKEKIMIKI